MQKMISALTIGDVPDVMSHDIADASVVPQNAWNDKLVDLTDIAEYLVRKGLPFRDAHQVSGRAVALAEKKGVQLNALSDEDWKGLAPQFGTEVHAVFDFAQSLRIELDPIRISAKRRYRFGQFCPSGLQQGGHLSQCRIIVSQVIEPVGHGIDLRLARRIAFCQKFQRV